MEIAIAITLRRHCLIALLRVVEGSLYIFCSGTKSEPCSYLIFFKKPWLTLFYYSMIHTYFCHIFYHIMNDHPEHTNENSNVCKNFFILKNRTNEISLFYVLENEIFKAVKLKQISMSCICIQYVYFIINAIKNGINMMQQRTLS